MKALYALLAAFLAISLFPLADAEAKRLGGGSNLGKQYQTMPRQATPPRQDQAPVAGQRAAAPAASGASRWLGPLAGLAAGGLLASLFFGDAFEGLQIFDILLILALVAGGFFLFRAMRRGQAGPAPAAAGYGGVHYAPGPGGMPGNLGSSAGLSAVGQDEAPAWFDGPGFAEGAKTHFIRLQAAWDQSDFRDIREYTTPQLFAELQQERQRLGQSPQFTEVVRLDAELLGVRRDGDMAVANIAFSGLIREDENAPASAFREIWHVQHVWSTREGDWLVAGIQQVPE